MSEHAETVRVERSARRVRTYLGGQPVADSTAALLVWENPYYPTYYLPLADLVDGALKPDGGERPNDTLGTGQPHTVLGGGKSAPGAAVVYADSPVVEIRDAVRLDWAAMDSWFEEDEEVFGHPRNPYTRIDALPSSRHVEVRLAGVTIAESRRPTLLFETGLPVRYYLPKPHVRMDLLHHTDASTHCPYKGTAEYWTAEVNGVTHDDLAWSYRTPLPESRGVAGLLAFPQDRVELLVDGVRV
jgi:uncharacterized protein (DUF427 family)